MRTYRIRENHGKFFVEIKQNYLPPAQLNETRWGAVDTHGNALASFNFNYPPLGKLNTFEEAEGYVMEFLQVGKKCIYYSDIFEDIYDLAIEIIKKRGVAPKHFPKKFWGFIPFITISEAIGIIEMLRTGELFSFYEEMKEKGHPDFK